MPKRTNDLLNLLQRTVKRSQDTLRLMSFNLFKANLVLQKYGNPADSGFLDGIVGQSKEFYEKFGLGAKSNDKPEFTESELYLMDMNKRLKKGERVQAEESPVQSGEVSENRGDADTRQNSSAEGKGFKSFEMDKAQDSHFSGQFNPIFEQNNEHEPSSQNESEQKPKTNNIFNRTDSLFQNLPGSALKDGASAQREGTKIKFKDDMEDLLKPTPEAKSELRDQDREAIEEKRVNETIMTEYIDESEVKDANSMNQGNRVAGEVGNVLLSSIKQSRDGEWK